MSGFRQIDHARAAATRRPRFAVPNAAAGFTLLEVIVVLTVLATLAGAVVPLVTAAVQAQKLDKVRAELAAIAEALERFYYEHGSFPSRLDAADFRGGFAQPGVGDDRLHDEWGARGLYRVAVAEDPDVITVYSVGENGADDGAAVEALRVDVHGSAPGGLRTRERMRIIAAALAAHLDAGGRVTGVWSSDRAAIGLGSDYDRDGFGVAFVLEGTTLQLRSAGADRRFGTGDDVSL